MHGSVPPLPNTHSWRGANKHWDNFALTLPSSDKFLLTLYYKFPLNTLIILTSLLGISDSIRVLYTASFLTETESPSKSINNWCSAPLYSYLFFSM
jgi:hypothetical protein